MGSNSGQTHRRDALGKESYGPQADQRNPQRCTHESRAPSTALIARRRRELADILLANATTTAQPAASVRTTGSGALCSLIKSACWLDSSHRGRGQYLLAAKRSCAWPDSMRPRRVTSAAAAATLLLFCTLGLQRDAAAASDVQILLIGSSLVRGIKPTLKKMYRQQGLRAGIKGAGRAKYTLADHAGSARTASIIASRSWDVVLMGQNSQTVTTFDLPDVETLENLITADGAASGLLMTWFDQDTPVSEYDLLKGTPDGTTGYVPLAFSLDIPIAPVGWGIRHVLLDIEAGDPIAQSLDMWKRRAHLGRAGRYLAGAIVYAALTGNSPVGQWTPNRLAGPTADYLQAVAADIVFSDPAEWNLPFP